MNPHPLFCPNLSCPSRGRENADNIRAHDTLRDRWRCTTCGKTFSSRQGTPFHRLRTDEQTVIQVLTLLANGCPLQAVVLAFGFDERTVKNWYDRAGRHCEHVHQELVTSHPMDLGQVQADEVRVRLQSRLQSRLVLWMAMAMAAPSRLWLGGVCSDRRDKHLIHALAEKVKSCACFCPILLLTDGLKSYVSAWRKVFRTPVRTGKRGRPQMLAWPRVVIGQVVKRYERGHVVDVEQRLVQGSIQELLPLLSEEKKINTAYIERLNATFRARLYCLVRRTRALARHPQTLSAGMYLVGCLYNFCTPHRSLAERDEKGRRCERTPAMAAGLTQRVWSIVELLYYRVPPAPWPPPKRRARKKPSQTIRPSTTDELLITV